MIAGMAICGAGTAEEGISTAESMEGSRLRVQAFSLDRVRLTGGPFKHALDLQVRALLQYEPDRLLAKFRSEAGLKPRAEHYKGWESNTVAGHSLGHYLSGCALAYKATGDARFKERVDYIVDELAAAQEADGDGYIGAFPRGKAILEEQVAKGNIRSKGFDLNGLWVPLYTHHKVMAGLRDAHRLAGNATALEVERRFADWLATVFTPLSEDQMQKVLACEHGGINEVLADLAADTGDGKYMGLSRRFHHRSVLDPLSRETDNLPGLHANTQVPKLVGLARRYELTGDPSDLRTAAFFWDRVVNHHSYVTGGHCNGEHFGPPDKLRDRLGPATTETCNVYNMLRLSRHLFQQSADPLVADFIERAIFNHILASQHPESGRVIYNLSLEMGGHKVYQDPYGFTCCVGSGMENHQKYGRFVYFHDDEGLYVNLYTASELSWPEKGIVVLQKTAFPEEQGTTLRFTCDKPVALKLNLRIPYWAKANASLKLNGRPVPVSSAVSCYQVIDRTWKTGDTLAVDLPFSLRLEPMPDDENRVAVCYGPLVLAADLGPVDDPRRNEPLYVPALVTDDRAPTTWLEAVPGAPNTFRTRGVGQPRDVVFKPFFQTHDRRYSVYLDLFSAARWDARRTELEAAERARKRLEARTIDVLQPGEMQPERDHDFQGDKTSVGAHAGRKWRHATGGGWFAYTLGCNPDAPADLVVTYWGDESFKRVFDVLADGNKVATQTLHRDGKSGFMDIVYPLPADLTRGKTRLTVRFQAQPGGWAGGVFGLRMVRREAE